MTRRRYPVPIEVLLVEDKDSLRSMLRLALERGGHEVIEARDQPEAEAALRERRPGLVLSDLRLPAGDGFGVLRAAKAADPDMPVVVMTAYGGVEEAVRAVREGALDFLAKPVDPDHLLLLVGRALEQRRLATENLLLKEELAVRRGAPQIVGEHESLHRLLASVQRAATSDTTVLIEGESGTGKELIARTLHVLSPRAQGPFVAINCAAIPETLLESELFGYEKGAFTGATTRKPGRFELAHRGTLFLDEIGDLPVGLQAKVLRALEEKTFERLCAAMGMPELARDPRYATNALRCEHADDLDAAVAAWFRTRTQAEVMAVFDAADVVAGPVLDISDIMRDPHYAARGNVVSVPDVDFGTVRMQGATPRFLETPGAVRHSGGALGADNRAVFVEGLGLAEAEFERLAAAGII